MSMKIVFLRDYPDYEVGWEGFVSRSLGSRLCYQEIAVPYSIKDHHAGYKAMIKKNEEDKREAEREAEEKEKAEREAKEKAELEAKEKAEQKAKEKAEREAEKKIKALKKKDATDRKTAVSKKAETREKSISGA